MAFQNRSAQSAQNSDRGPSVALAISALLSCSVIAASAGGLAWTFSAMRDAAQTISGTHLSLAAPIRIRETAVVIPRPRSAVRATKSTRILTPTETEIRRRQLTADAIRTAHHRGVAIRLALAESKREAEMTRAVVAAAKVERAAVQNAGDGKTRSLVNALVEDVSVRDMEPFGLVLTSPDMDEELALPSQIPLPEARPLIETVARERKLADDTPVVRRKRDGGKNTVDDKPERSLFSSLFNDKTDKTAWPGEGTRVAIYDVSNATVYMPDGTRLRAHSGIGRMRDNPRYDHVTMKGPTPAGIYRLTMREKRFHGVEAIRMTSIDGRHPKNRTGLLTHTNLLRGQKGSHGCVAFQNYEPFLRAFKRGHVTMMIVVPELPSSRTHLAALYRKAGA